jgi:hypothetical protein
MCLSLGLSLNSRADGVLVLVGKSFEQQSEHSCVLGPTVTLALKQPIRMTEQVLQQVSEGLFVDIAVRREVAGPYGHARPAIENRAAGLSGNLARNLLHHGGLGADNHPLAVALR